MTTKISCRYYITPKREGENPYSEEEVIIETGSSATIHGVEFIDEATLKNNKISSKVRIEEVIPDSSPMRLSGGELHFATENEDIPGSSYRFFEVIHSP